MYTQFFVEIAWGNLGVAVRIISKWVLRHGGMVCTVFVLLKQGPEAHLDIMQVDTYQAVSEDIKLQ